ncbi:hypothetical protein chiPu_0025687 [Chiloscyllium punctatum]|uniref:Uncharacterized protein n=1 Tax=Chiloscyllium punctatum TaxID=137246 RepID=A0A401TH03_CHIPU|nr:hypothetical protein [Chiloscyllium punctatum]
MQAPASVLRGGGRLAGPLVQARVGQAGAVDRAPLAPPARVTGRAGAEGRDRAVVGAGSTGGPMQAPGAGAGVHKLAQVADVGWHAAAGLSNPKKKKKTQINGRGITHHHVNGVQGRNMSTRCPE